MSTSTNTTTDTNATNAITNDSEENGDDESVTNSPATADPGRSRRVIMLGLLGIGIAGAGLWSTADELSLLAAAAIGLCWYRLSELYAVALGHGVLVWLIPTDSLTPELLIVECGLLILLIAPAMDADVPGSVILTTVAALAGLVAIGIGSYQWSSELWITASVILGALIGGGYMLYRYELIRLDLVEEGSTT